MTDLLSVVHEHRHLGDPEFPFRERNYGFRFRILVGYSHAHTSSARRLNARNPDVLSVMRLPIRTPTRALKYRMPMRRRASSGSLPSRENGANDNVCAVVEHRFQEPPDLACRMLAVTINLDHRIASKLVRVAKSELNSCADAEIDGRLRQVQESPATRWRYRQRSRH